MTFWRGPSEEKSNLSLLELNSLIAEKPTELYKLTGKSRAENLDKFNYFRVPLIVEEVASGKVFKFSSLVAVASNPPLKDIKVSI